MMTSNTTSLERLDAKKRLIAQLDAALELATELERQAFEITDFVREFHDMRMAA